MVNNFGVIGRLFDSRCALCGAPADTLCARCVAALPYNRSCCPRCAEPLTGPGTGNRPACGRCQRHPPAFDRVTAPLLLVPPVHDLMTEFKDRLRLPAGRVLASLLGDALAQRRDWPSLLVPMPATADRLRRRGFNQAIELARPLAARFAIPLDHGLLTRRGPWRDQRGLGRAERQRNVRDSFEVRGELPRHVALIDDVVTTATTADAASTALRRAGARQIEVWAVARTPHDR